jgi:hypothetical protein
MSDSLPHAEPAGGRLAVALAVMVSLITTRGLVVRARPLPQRPDGWGAGLVAQVVGGVEGGVAVAVGGGGAVPGQDGALAQRQQSGTPCPHGTPPEIRPRIMIAMADTPRFRPPEQRPAPQPGRRSPRPDVKDWPALARRLAKVAADLKAIAANDLPDGEPDPDTLKAVRRALNNISQHTGKFKKELF